MGRFFGLLKSDWLSHRTHDTIDEVRSSVFRYIEVFCNRVRRHQTIVYDSPEEFERDHLRDDAA
jgi:putative transposase